MDLFNRVVDTALWLYFTALSWAPPVLGLTLLSAAAGVGMLWVVRRTSNQRRIRQVKRAAAAALLELRVYADEPAATGRALKSLFAANFRYMALALKPALWMALPMALLLLHLESFYGRAPLAPGREALVTMRMAPGWDFASAAPQLTAPQQVRVTSPPVRVADSREVSWRLLPEAPVSGNLLFNVGGTTVRKRIEAGDRQRFTPARVVSSPVAVLWTPGEFHIPSRAVEWIEVRYDEASLRVFGLRINWVVWFFATSIFSALVFKKRWGVVI
jgi:hypothetical protein